MVVISLRLIILCVMATVVFTPDLAAQEGKSRDQLVREDLSNFGATDKWIYNDVARGYATAREMGKPLLVVFRCIPCEACAQLDRSIVERDPRVQALLDQYVCVRVVSANGMDLQLFQFDYDQSFAAFMLNGDKTIYGRYGTRSHQTRSEDDVSLEGFAEALKAGLEVHAHYPDNKSELAGKQPQSRPRYSTPEQYPRLKQYARSLNYNGRVAASCIHCHQVGEVLITALRDAGKPIPTKSLFPYPHPKVLGLIMDPKQKATVARVEPNSPAKQNGFRAGDEISSLDGQVLLSTADIQWVLHNATDGEELSALIRRNGQPLQLAVKLAPGWRRNGDISWRATSWALRRMTTGGMRLEDLSSERRAERNIDDGALALLATHVGQFGEHAHAKRQGFQKGDVIISVAGQSRRMSESELFAHLVNKRVGEEVPITLVRGPQQLQLKLVMQK